MDDGDLHAGAWWLWALGAAAVALRSTNLIVLGVVFSLIVAVVSTCRRPGPATAAFNMFIKLGAAVVVFRVVLGIVAGNSVGGTIAFRLPELDLGSWASGITLGGDVSVETLVSSLRQGAQLAVMLAAFGAVNTLCSPYRALRLLPAAMFEVGVAASVAMSTAPQAVISAARIRQGRRLRGRPTKGVAGLRHLAMPVLESSLDRSVTLAASMDARGFGRSSPNDDAGAEGRRNRAVLGGVACSAISLYFLMAPGGNVAVGVVATVVAFAAIGWAATTASRLSARSRYRRDRWTARSTLVGAGVGAAVATSIVAGWLDPLSLDPSIRPLRWGPTPLWLVVGLLGLGVPALVAPAPTTKLAPTSVRVPTAVPTP